MTWPTPSKLALAELCAYPWHPTLLPLWVDTPPSDDAAFGSAFHRAMQVAAVWGGLTEGLLEQIAAEQKLSPGEETRLLAAVELGVDLLAAVPDFRAAEVSILYDVERDTARILPEALARDQVPAGCIHGTIDLLEVWGDDGLCITDWKTGGRSDELDARTDPQLRTYALMAARALGRKGCAVSILHVRDDGIDPDTWHLDAFDLALARAALRKTLAKVDAGGPPRPGRHCSAKYCPAIGSCPVTQRAIAEVQVAVEAQLPMGLVIESPEHAARVRLGIRAVEDALEQYRAVLHAYVSTHGPIEIAPGVRWGRIEREGNERIDAEVAGAVTVIQELLGAEADLALEVWTSKAAIERAARAHAKARGIEGRGALKQITDPVLARLRALGAIKQGAPSVRFDEIKDAKAKKEGKAA